MGIHGVGDSSGFWHRELDVEVVCRHRGSGRLRFWTNTIDIYSKA